MAVTSSTGCAGTNVVGKEAGILEYEALYVANLLGPIAPARRKKAGSKPYAGLCNVPLYDKYLQLLHQLKLRSGANYTRYYTMQYT